MKPIIREHITLLEKGPSAAKFFCSNRRQLLTYQVDEHGLRAMSLADGRRNLEEILADMKAPHLTKEDLNAFFTSLSKDLLYRDSASDSKVEFAPEYETRLERQLIYLSGLAPEGQTGRDLQDALRRSRILVVGAGGGGSHLAVQLAGIGVGELIVVDPDRVEVGNLGRQIFYADHIGELKVEVLKGVVGSISPETKVTARVERLTQSPEWLGEFLPQIDLVLNCADHPSMDETSRWLFDACYPYRVPLIPAGGYNGHITSLPPTVLPGRSTCWPCYAKATERKIAPKISALRLSEIRSGIFLPATIAMAALQMPEIVRVLTGYESPRFTNCRGEFDLNTCDLKLETIAPTPGCGTCEGTA